MYLIPLTCSITDDNSKNILMGDSFEVDDDHRHHHDHVSLAL